MKARLAEFDQDVAPAQPVDLSEVWAKRIVHDAKTQANLLISVASMEATRIQELALEEADRLKCQALLAGQQEGVEKAQREMEAQLQRTADRCNALLLAAEQEAKRIVVGAEHQIIEMVLAISRKVICDEMEERADVIMGIVKSALDRVRDQSHINIHVSLDDYERVLLSRRELQGIVGAEQTIAVTADTVLAQGGCLIETSFGTVEAGVETQLDSIRRALTELLP